MLQVTSGVAEVEGLHAPPSQVQVPASRLLDATVADCNPLLAVVVTTRALCTVSVCPVATARAPKANGWRTLNAAVSILLALFLAASMPVTETACAPAASEAVTA